MEKCKLQIEQCGVAIQDHSVRYRLVKDLSRKRDRTKVRKSKAEFAANCCARAQLCDRLFRVFALSSFRDSLLIMLGCLKMLVSCRLSGKRRFGIIRCGVGW
jgi:hypothetical protein